MACAGVAKTIAIFEENSIDYELTQKNQFEYFQAKSGGKLRLVSGDFYNLTPDDLGGKFDCVWDRGFLCNTPIEKRIK